MSSSTEQRTTQEHFHEELVRRPERLREEPPCFSRLPNVKKSSEVDIPFLKTLGVSIDVGIGDSSTSTLAPGGVPFQGVTSRVPGGGVMASEAGGKVVDRGQQRGLDSTGGGVGAGVMGVHGGVVGVSTPAQGMEGVAMERGGNVEVGMEGAAKPGLGRFSGGSDTESEDFPDEDPGARDFIRKKFRRACDYCTKKKVRCDGTPPCSQCKKRKMECRFSICQRSGPRSMSYPAPAGAERMQSHGLPPAIVAAAVAAATAAGAAVGGVGSPPSTQMATALSGGGITSKVDVTYLNFFLKEFNAFVPLTTQNVLRDALSPSPEALTESSPNGDEEYRRQNARVAAIQGCISIGAMLKGNTQVVGYLRNVREALTNSFDFVSAETMGAYMVAAYCHDLMGNAAATRNYMEFAKAVATQLPQVTVDHELVFQFYRVCSEIHNSTLSATPKLLQHVGAAAPCYQVLNVLTYALYDLAHLAGEELVGAITKAQVVAELNSLLPIIARANGMSRDNASSFGALGMVLIKGVMAYILVRLGRSQKGLEVLGPLVKLLTDNPGLLRQVMCWHLSHCMLVIFLEHGWFKEYEIVRVVYNRVLNPEKKEAHQHFVAWGRGHFQDALPYPQVERLHSHGNSFLCTNPICKAINRDLSEGVESITASSQVAVGRGPQPLINMVTGEGFISFDSQEGVNRSLSRLTGAGEGDNAASVIAPAPSPAIGNDPANVIAPAPARGNGSASAIASAPAKGNDPTGVIAPAYGSGN